MSELDFETVISRLKTELGARTDLEVAKTLGMSAPAFANRKKNDSLPYEEIVAAAMTRSLDLVFVLTGSRTRARNVTPLRPGVSEVPSRYAAGDDFERVPLYDVRAAAGFGAFIHDEPVEDWLAFRKPWIDRTFGDGARDLRLLYVAGESMEPILSDGDVIMINRADDQPRRDGVYVLRIDDALLVKNLQRLPGGMIRVSGANPAYEPFSVHQNAFGEGGELRIVGRVVWAARRF